nr:hypothetical protein [Tanacetum cinerariifolium]
MRPQLRCSGPRPHGNYMRPPFRPASHRPHGPSMNPRRPIMNENFPLAAQNFPLLIWERKETLLRPQRAGFGSLDRIHLIKGSSQNNIDDKGYWDSGCSRHITGNISYLSDYEPSDRGYVSFGQGGCKITGKGTIKIECIVLGRDFKLLDDANVLLRTPRLVRHNLVRGLPSKCFENDHTCTACLKGKQHKASLTDDFSRFTWTFFLKTKDETSGILRKFITEIENLKDLKVKIIRCDNKGEFRNKEMDDFCLQKRIKREFSNARTPQRNGVAERRNRTLIEAARTMLADAKLPVTFWAEAVNTAYECMMWHRRLGHLNFKTMNKLVRHNLVRGLPTKCFENDHTGIACLKGKQHKAFCKSKLVNSVSNPLHTLLMDLFGPTSDESSGILRKFITEIENLKDLKVKIIRCDNGGEFRNKEMNDFCSQKGIKREFSNARTPQQNGVAERRNKTLIEAARTMLADAKLPITFWAEAVNTNKSQNKTPYELFNGRTPAIGFLKPFGYHVRILNTLDKLGKFEAKGDE